MRRYWSSAVLVSLLSVTLSGQTPQPFPRPGAPTPAAPPTQTPSPAPAPVQQTLPAVVDPAAPSPEALGVPIYPAARFLASYDAGRGQRYYLFGATAPYEEIVAYYRAQLDSGGDRVYREPATHMFTGGRLPRFREELMAFPPSVTVKDWTFGGSAGYPNAAPGATPARFPTVIMIVPAPPDAVR